MAGGGGVIRASITSHVGAEMEEITKAENAEIQKAEVGTPTPLHHLSRRENSEGFLPFFFSTELL